MLLTKPDVTLNHGSALREKVTAQLPFPLWFIVVLTNSKKLINQDLKAQFDAEVTNMVPAGKPVPTETFFTKYTFIYLYCSTNIYISIKCNTKHPVNTLQRYEKGTKY